MSDVKLISSGVDYKQIGRSMKYSFNQVCKYYEVENESGFYASMSPDEYASLMSNPDKYDWTNQGAALAGKPTFPSYTCRVSSAFSEIPLHDDEKINLANVDREKSVLADKMAKVRDSLLWDVAFDHVNHVNLVNFDESVTLDEFFASVEQKIIKSTHGGVKSGQVYAVMSPPTAMQISARGPKSSSGWIGGLPPKIGNVTLIIEPNIPYRRPQILFVAKQGGQSVDGPVAEDFTSLGVFVKKGMEMVASHFNLPPIAKVQFEDCCCFDVVCPESSVFVDWNLDELLNI